MKRISVFALFTLAGFLTAGNAVAQQHSVQANVPFDFTVGNKVLPAGTYSIASVMDSAIEIRNAQTHSAVLTRADSDSNRSQNGGVLVFEKRGSRYTLREILCESAAMNVSLPTEKKNKNTLIQEAQLYGDTSHVLIAAR